MRDNFIDDQFDETKYISDKIKNCSYSPNNFKQLSRFHHKYPKGLVDISKC